MLCGGVGCPLLPVRSLESNFSRTLRVITKLPELQIAPVWAQRREARKRSATISGIDANRSSFVKPM
jgi:hypothetical protein